MFLNPDAILFKISLEIPFLSILTRETDRPTDGHTLLKRCVNAFKKIWFQADRSSFEPVRRFFLCRVLRVVLRHVFLRHAFLHRHAFLRHAFLHRRDAPRCPTTRFRLGAWIPFWAAPIGRLSRRRHFPRRESSGRLGRRRRRSPRPAIPRLGDLRLGPRRSKVEWWLVRCRWPLYRQHSPVWWIYGVVKKKVNHKREEKMHSKVKMTLQRAENLVHVQQHHGKHFYKKIFF